jgi:hypothetical protein
MLTDAHKETRKTVCGVNSWHSSPDRPDVAPSDYHLVGKPKESLRGTRFEDDAIIAPLNSGSDAPVQSIQALVPRWRKAV